MRTLLACAALCLFVTACGFKGALYLPKPVPGTAAAQPSAPQAVTASAAK